jgi:hypothetical protein
MSIDIKWLAGFIDGEGHIKRYNLLNGRKERHWTTCICIVQSSINNGEQVLKDIKSVYGGTVSCQTKGQTNPVWRIDIRGKRADSLYNELLPYLRIKRLTS